MHTLPRVSLWGGLPLSSLYAQELPVTTDLPGGPETTRFQRGVKLVSKVSPNEDIWINRGMGREGRSLVVHCTDPRGDIVYVGQRLEDHPDL